MPSATSSSTNALVTGRVVDTATNSGLGGIAVVLSSRPHTAQTVATTASDGSFAFASNPGTYGLQIGTQQTHPADGRATLHATVTLVAGANALVAPFPHPLADVTPQPGQISGAFRLARLSANEEDCLNGMNAGREQRALPQLVPDEYLLETARAWVDEETAQQTEEPSPAWGADYPYIATPALGTTTAFASAGISCSGWWTQYYSFVPGNPPYDLATDPDATLYGASWASSRTGDQYGMQTWE